MFMLWSSLGLSVKSVTVASTLTVQVAVLTGPSPVSRVAVITTSCLVTFNPLIIPDSDTDTELESELLHVVVPL